MAEKQFERCLAADVAGYSRLMELDEEGTLAALKRHRRELIDPEDTERSFGWDHLVIRTGESRYSLRCGSRPSPGRLIRWSSAL
jgi:adenylate cyclase